MPSLDVFAECLLRMSACQVSSACSAVVAGPVSMRSAAVVCQSAQQQHVPAKRRQRLQALAEDVSVNALVCASTLGHHDSTWTPFGK